MVAGPYDDFAQFHQLRRNQLRVCPGNPWASSLTLSYPLLIGGYSQRWVLEHPRLSAQQNSERGEEEASNAGIPKPGAAVGSATGMEESGGSGLQGQGAVGQCRTGGGGHGPPPTTS